MSPDENTSHLLAQAQANEPVVRDEAYEELLRRAEQRLGVLAQYMLGHCAATRRWVQADDLVQETQLRLLSALQQVRFHSSEHFWRTARWHLRFALIDLARHHGGPQGQGAHHHTDPGGRAADDDGQPLALHPDIADDSATLEEWARFHEAVDTLSDHHRVLFDLLYYQGLTQEEAARKLAMPLRTLKAHWQKARAELGRRLREQ
jgi:RNA polymerase sigma-70 factor (ECF subfamily)